MPVAFDAKGTAAVGGTDPVSFTNLTVGSGVDRALEAYIAIQHTSDLSGSMTVTWDYGASNQALSLIHSLVNATVGVQVQKWGLVNPVSGNKTLRIAGFGAHSITVDALSVTGADQTGGSVTFKNVATAVDTSGSGSASVTVTSSNSAFVSAIFAAQARPFASVDNSEIFITGGSVNSAANYAAGASSVTLTASFGLTDLWVALGSQITERLSIGSAAASAVATGLSNAIIGTTGAATATAVGSAVALATVSRAGSAAASITASSVGTGIHHLIGSAQANAASAAIAHLLGPPSLFPIAHQDDGVMEMLTTNLNADIGMTISGMTLVGRTESMDRGQAQFILVMPPLTLTNQQLGIDLSSILARLHALDGL